MKPALCLAALLLGAALGAATQAQTVYRCGPDGRSYAQTPCAGGRAVQVNDERSAEQRREAIEVTERERALGEALVQERQAREAEPKPGAGHIDGRSAQARLAHAEQAKKAMTSKKKRPAKGTRQAERYKATSAARQAA
jgi:hypothetical protein